MSKIICKMKVDPRLDTKSSPYIAFETWEGTTINWGDGESTTISGQSFTLVPHTYSVAKEYEITFDIEELPARATYWSVGIDWQNSNKGNEWITEIHFYNIGKPIKFAAAYGGYGCFGYARNLKIIDFGDCNVDLFGNWNNGIFHNCGPVDYLFIPSTLVFNSGSAPDGYANQFNGCTINNVVWNGTADEWAEFLNTVPATGNQTFFNANVIYNVTYSYDTAGGTLQSGFDNPNTAASFPSPMPTCTKTGWTFAGWYKDPTFNTPVVAGSAIDVTTIYAKFAAAVTYSLNGGTNNALNPTAYTPTDVANARPLFAATKAGYDFAGWYTNSAFANKVTNFGGFTGAAVTLYAKFEEQEKYSFKIKTGANAAAEKKLDAYTVRGRDGYVNENLSSLNNMGELLATVTEINARNEHALFDASAFITGAYVCLIKMTDSGTTHLCEIHDLINNRVYLNDDGYALTDGIEDYIAACSVKTSYENIGVPSGMTMGELRTFINGVNSRGDHCFFDFSGYLDNAYVCTVLAYTQSAINYVFIFDILNGKVYGSYTGYTDATTVTSYLSGNESDIVHAIKLADANMTLSDMAVLLNKVNQLGHHVLFDVSTIASGKYLVSCTAGVSGSNVVISLFDIVSSKVLKATSYTGTTKLTVALAAMVDIATSNELAGKADAIAGASALSLPYTAADGTSGTFTIYGKITPNS